MTETAGHHLFQKVLPECNASASSSLCFLRRKRVSLQVADFRVGSKSRPPAANIRCPLSSQQRTFTRATVTSALCRRQTFVVARSDDEDHDLRTRALLLPLTDPPCGRTSQGMARLLVVGFFFRPRMWRSFTFFEARSINFAIVV